MAKIYIVALKIEGIKKPKLLQFPAKKNRDEFIFELKRRDPDCDYATTEMYVK